MMTKRKFLLGGIAAILAARKMPAVPIRSAVGGYGIGRVQLDGGTHYMAQDYVQDGLVAMWDGIENVGLGEHDALSEVWVDLTGNGNDMLATTDGLIWFDKNSFVLSSSERHLMSCSSLSYDVANLATNRGKTFVTGQVKDLHATAEYVVRINSSPSGNAGLFTAQAGSYYTPVLRTYNRQLRSAAPYSGVERPLVSSAVLGQMYSVSSCTSNMDVYNVRTRRIINEKVNGETVVALDGNYGDPNIEIALIMAGPNDRFPVLCEGHIHSIRLYNVALSDEERAYNYMIDQERFGL